MYVEEKDGERTTSAIKIDEEIVLGIVLEREAENKLVIEGVEDMTEKLKIETEGIVIGSATFSYFGAMTRS